MVVFLRSGALRCRNLSDSDTPSLFPIIIIPSTPAPSNYLLKRNSLFQRVCLFSEYFFNWLVNLFPKLFLWNVLNWNILLFLNHCMLSHKLSSDVWLVCYCVSLISTQKSYHSFQLPSYVIQTSPRHVYCINIIRVYVQPYETYFFIFNIFNGNWKSTTFFFRGK